jgi:hypothetical protein
MNRIETQFPITEVVVYPSNGLVTRKKKLGFIKGENKLVIKNVPKSLSVDTVRIETGTRLIGIDDISVIDSIIENYDENKYRTVKEELDRLSIGQKNLEALYQAYNAEFLLFLNKESLIESAKNDNFRSINVKNWAEFFAFLRAQALSNRGLARETIFKWLEQRREIESANANLGLLESYDQTKEHTIAVSLKAEKDTEEEISVKYIADSVSWYPAYSIRADLGQKAISISMYAIVAQSTGEDWENLSLLLSTAVPLASCDVPELKSMLIKEKAAEIVLAPMRMLSRAVNAAEDVDEYMAEDKKADQYAGKTKDQRKSARKKARMKEEFAPSAKSIASGFAAGGPAPIVAQEAMTTEKSPFGQSERSEEGLGAISSLLSDVESRVFRELPIGNLAEYFEDYDSFMKDSFKPEEAIPISSESRMNPAFANGISPLYSCGGFDYRYTVRGVVERLPSGGSPVQIGVDIVNVPFELEYISIPLENEAVYLKATFTNQYANPLPQGPAQVFALNNFLGNIMFPTLGPNERTSISLGIDRDIKIIRKEDTKRKTGGVLKKEIVSEIAIAIELVSFKNEKADVIVFERIPISENPREIEIFEEQFSEEPLFISKRKIVAFKAALLPKEKKTITMTYSIKHPEDYRLSMRMADHPHFDSEGENRS